MAIGSPNSSNGIGEINVYKFTSGNWVQHGTSIVGIGTDENFGYSVSLSSDGNILAVGVKGGLSPMNQGNNGNVRVYTFNGSDWDQLGLTIGTIQNALNVDEFGHSVSLSSDGSTIAIGAPSGGDPDPGFANVYTYDGVNWVQLGTEIWGPLAGNTGSSVSLNDNGDIIAIGAPSASTGGDSENGLVKVYNYIGSNWVQIGSDITLNGVDDFGHSVSLNFNGNIIAISGLVAGEDYSSIRQVYEYDGSNWIQMGDDIIDESFNNLGFEVSLSATGHTLACTGSNTLLEEPKVEIYSYNGLDWVLIGSEITGDVGGMVSISAQGNRIACGNIFPNNMIEHVSVFEFIESVGLVEETGHIIFPNPVTNVLNIDLMDKSTYNLYSVLGKESVQSGYLQQGKNTLNLSYLDKGVYFLKIGSQQGNIVTKRVVKQ